MSTSLYSNNGQAVALLGPQVAWSGSTQDDLFESTIGPMITTTAASSSGTYVDGIYQEPELNQTAIDKLISSSRQFFPDIDGIVTQITNYSGQGFYGFGIFSPAPETVTFFYSSQQSLYTFSQYSQIFNLITNRIANSSASTGSTKEVQASVRAMRQPSNEVNFLSLPITALLVLAFICATSISVSCPEPSFS